MQKHSILDVWRDPEYASAEKQGRCKVCKKALKAAAWNANLRDMCFKIFQWY